MVEINEDNVLTDSEFMGFRGLIYKRCGMELPANRRKPLERAVIERMKCAGSSTPAEYLAAISAPPARNNGSSCENDDGEFGEFVNCLVVPETSFFRTMAHFDALTKGIFPEILKSRDPGTPVTIWSAGCSVGPEPYTIAMLLMELFPGGVPGRFKIVATDLSDRSLDEARKGCYPERMLRKAPEAFCKKYFCNNMESFEISPAVKDAVSFSRHNLMDFAAYPKKVSVIFCRNVLIYFSSETRAKIINAFRDSLEDGGYLVLGHSETLRNYPDLFESVWHEGTFVYRKSDGGAARAPKPLPAFLQPKPAQGVDPAACPAPRVTIAKQHDTRLFLKPRAPVAEQSRSDVLEIEGKLDSAAGAESSQIKIQFMKFIEVAPPAIVIDLNKVSFIDNEGLAFLKRAIRHLSEAGTSVAVVTQNLNIARWLEKANIGSSAPVFPGEAEARKYLNERNC